MARFWIGGAAAVAAAAGLAAWAIGIVATPHATGYFAPVFSPDGQSVLAIARDVRAVVTGFGFETFTPPATVRLQRDRFSLIRIRVSDRSITVVESFPPSPLEGDSIKAYHGAIFGSPHAHLRWADADHLEYEIGVTRHDSPLSRTFVIRRVWDGKAGAYVRSAPWEERSTGMGGLEPQRLYANLEAIAVPGEEAMPCAVSLLRPNRVTRTLVQTRQCRSKYPEGITWSVLESASRRAEIERAETVKTTYADLVSRGRSAGQSEGDAMLGANKEMQRRGFFPKTPTLAADAAGCATASPLFTITDMEFTAGLFPDIEAAIAQPGTEVDKSMGAYVMHSDYTTSRQINEYLAADRSTFFVRARGRCWRMVIR